MLNKYTIPKNNTIEEEAIDMKNLKSNRQRRLSQVYELS